MCVMCVSYIWVPSPSYIYKAFRTAYFIGRLTDQTATATLFLDNSLLTSM